MQFLRNEIPLSTNTHNMFIKEIYLEGFDSSKQIELRSIRKAWYDSAGDQKYHTDFTLKYSGDPTQANIAGFGYTRDTEESALQLCDLKFYTLTAGNNSGISGYVIIDYSQLETGSRILNPYPHVILNPNKYKFLPNNPSIENYITNQQISDYLPYIRQKFTNIYSVGHQGFGAGQNGYRGNSLTGFKKGAIFGFTRSLARNLALKNIRVNAIAPGFFWTPLQPACWVKEKIPSLGADAAMARGAMPYELGPTFVFLGSDESSYMTGQVMHINGGQVMG